MDWTVALVKEVGLSATCAGEGRDGLIFAVTNKKVSKANKSRTLLRILNNFSL